MSHGHGAGHEHGAEGENKWVAIAISVLALFLAIAETFAKSAQTATIASTVESSNLWAFYQAKTIRQTTIKTATEGLEVDLQRTSDATAKQLIEKRVADWKAEVARYQSEPKADGRGEGRKELQERAIAEGKKRDLYAEKYHHFEFSSACFQIAIVLASVYLITHVSLMIGGSALLTAAGIFFFILGQFFPHTHIF